MTRPTLENPVLRGFNPDPSFLRVGADYYIATSSFEWFPGVNLYHSRDLAHWRLVGAALTRTSQLNLRGITDSCGVWAPSLSFADGRFWLIYTTIRTAALDRPFKDIGIYLVTAPDISGPWSEPVALNAIGFDPSLFHDTDGRKWLVNMRWDFRQSGLGRFAGIVVQEYDPRLRQLIGRMTTLVEKDVLVEGPNLYRRGDGYHLLMAEGGTSWNHGISQARSRSITGPYELDPEAALLTTRHDPGYPLQKAGHGELVETAAGEWYLAHLCSRPVGPQRRCILGRETAIQKVRWSDDGWLRLESGGVLPQLRAPIPRDARPDTERPPAPARDEFNIAQLGPEWNALREPMDPSWFSLSERPGWLRLRGRESMHSRFSQSLVARRLTSVYSIAETCVEFAPTHYTQMAGLICWYDTDTHFYLRITHEETRGRVLGLIQTDGGRFDISAETQQPVNDWTRFYLRATFAGESLQFAASRDGERWDNIGPLIDATKLSDDYGAGLHFTGAFVGLCAQDLNATRAAADFDYFSLTEYTPVAPVA